MPGGGQLPLVAYGNQNVIVSGNPQMTYFYHIHKRYTHFSQEAIVIPVDGPNELMMDTPIRLRAKIPRHADLLTNLTLLLDIPDIYSKIWGNRAPAFRWIHMLGALIIDNLAIYIGGSKIQEFPGEWIALRAQADMSTDKYLKWRAMVGDVPELHSPEWGINGHSPSYPFAKGEYPNCVSDESGADVGPSVTGRTLRVPLPFWFSEEIGRALPLIALQLHEVEVQITLRTLRELYRIMDPTTQRDPVRYGQTLTLNPALPTSYNPDFPTDYDNLTLQDNYTPVSSDPSGGIRFFYTDPSVPVPQQDGFNMNPRLEGNYIYLTEKEQVLFAERELRHLVHQVQTFRFPSVIARTRLDIDAHNLVHRILFFGRRSDAIESRNDYLNLSNWKNLNQAPYWPTSGAAVSNGGRYLQYQQRDILRSARIIAAGNEIQEEKPASYFELQAPFQNNTGAGSAGVTPGSGIKPDDVMGPVYHYNFAINASDHSQPSGTLNTSRLREFQLEVQPWNIDPEANYIYDFTAHVESLNVVVFTNGMAALEFAV